MTVPGTTPGIALAAAGKHIAVVVGVAERMVALHTRTIVVVHTLCISGGHRVPREEAQEK